MENPEPKTPVKLFANLALTMTLGIFAFREKTDS